MEINSKKIIVFFPNKEHFFYFLMDFEIHGEPNSKVDLMDLISSVLAVNSLESEFLRVKFHIICQSV